MTSRAAAALLSLVALAVPVLAEEAPAASASPKEILERARAAQGGAAWDGIRGIRFAGTLSTGGLTGRIESVVDVSGGRFHDVWQLGPMKGANGWDGRQAWSQDDSGIARVDGAETARRGVISDAYRRAQGYWYPERAAAEIRALGERKDGDRAFQVLSIAPPGGRPFELWVAADGLFDRVVEEDSGRTSTTFLGDWREVGGVKQPFSMRTTRSDDDPVHDVTVAWTEAALEPAMADATFALPPPPPPDFGFTGGKRRTTVPFQIRNGHIYASVKLNGKGPFLLLVDTGGVNIVTPEVARALGLEAEGKLFAGGVGEKTENFGLTKVKRIQVGDAYVDNQSFLVYPLDEMSPVEGLSEQGLIGYEVFRRFAAKIDYAGQKLTLFHPDAFRYQGSGTVVPFVFNEHIPQVEGEVDGIPGKFDLDTGSRASLDLLAPFVEANGLRLKYGAGPERIGGWGVGGPSREQTVRARLLRLGSVDVPEPVMGLSTATKGGFADDQVAGNVGYGVLSRFTLYLDYARQQVIFEKNARFARRDSYDKAGVWLHLVDGAFQVIEVVPGSPAAESGLQEGDRIVSVNGLTPAQLTLHGLRMLLREKPAGTRVELRVRRSDGVKAVRLVLRDLV